jgi:hypothetical protein
MVKKMIECRRCILNDNIPGVTIGESGECNYCDLHDELNKQYPTGKEGKILLNIIYDRIKDQGNGKPYDCIIGISGGCDSSYALAHLVDNGLRPLAVHWDNNFNTKIARENIENITRALGVDTQYYRVDKAEYNDLCLSFLKARVPDADIPNDIALTKVLYQAAELVGTRYIINAHSFRTEGSTPLGWSYMDGGYIEDVNRLYGRMPLITFPNLGYEEFKKYILQRYQRIRPLYFIDYHKENAIKELEKRFNWRWYGGHHLENDYTIFVGSYLQPRYFDMDLRYVEFSALVRSKQITRKEAEKQIRISPQVSPFILKKIFGRLGIQRNDFDKIMSTPQKSYHDYRTYQPRFKEDKTFFKQAFDQGLVPATFYRKYCEGI